MSMHSFCTEINTDTGETTVRQNDLRGLFYSVAVNIPLPVNDGREIIGVTVDTGADGMADGIDLNDDNEPDLVYSPDEKSALSFKSLRNGDSSVPFQFEGIETAFFFVAYAGSFQIYPERHGESFPVSLVVSAGGGAVLGISTTGSLQADIIWQLPLVSNVPVSTLVQPSSDAVIGQYQSIEIFYSEAVDLSSVTLSGSMAEQAGLVTLSDNSLTVRVNPAGGWGGGAQSLQVSAAGEHGLQADVVSLEYTVDKIDPVLQSVTPAAPVASMTGTSPVVFIFSEGIDNSASQFEMQNDPGFQLEIQYSTTFVQNDTISISPAAGGDWSQIDHCYNGFLFSVYDDAGNGSSDDSGPYGTNGCG